MRTSGLSPQLEAALGEYAQAAAHLLHADILAGAEVELELGSQRGRAQTPFYSCRPLTERFIAQREAQLSRLPEHSTGARRARGVRRARPLPRRTQRAGTGAGAGET